ncbi:MAG: PHP domain-containing protein, partial [Bacteroidales bacterium]|nr:PHP domain-containing protein [Bacteroidales bacterium]
MLFTSHSYYSLRYGTLSVEDLVAGAKAQGLQALVLADINNTSATTDFIRECKEHDIRPVAGVSCHNEGEFKYLLIARNNKGFREINDLLSELNIRKLPLPCPAPDFEDVIVVYPLISAPEKLEKENEYIGIKHWELNRLVSSPWRHNQTKLLAWHQITFTGTKGFELHRHLRAIDNNCLLSKLPATELAHPGQTFLDPHKARQAFSAWEQLLLNSNRVLGMCNIDFDFKSIKNKKSFTGHPYDDRILLEKLAMDGLAYRYGKSNKEALRRIRHELEIIDRLGFSAYFLITWDIIRYSMSRGFYHVGRGSGANSIVAYCLRITDVDPIAIDLYFERFINPLRTSLPDFDIDYSWKERDEVLDYIFKRYGRLHTALLGAMSTFKGKSILRELGKVFGLPKSEIDELVEKPPKPEQQGPLIRRLMEVGVQMVDFPNIRSI